MLGMKKSNRAAVKSFVGSETRVHGDIEFTGGFHVDGYVKGNIEGVKDDAAVLSISETGCVEGSVVVPHLLLNGIVRGDVRATERVELGPGARVIGNVQYKLIEMSIGAEVNYLLSLVLVQTISHDSRVSGVVTLTIEGSRDGAVTALPLDEVLVEPGPSEIPFGFRYFQGLQRELVLPADFEPSQVNVEIRSGETGGQRILHSYAWPAASG